MKLQKAVVAATLACTFSVSAQIGDSQAMAAQKIAVAVCASCHGVDGNSMLPTIPKLAGLQRMYLVKQMRDYIAGKRTNGSETPCGPQLNPNDIIGLADYFNGQKPAAGKPGDLALAAEGKKVYELANSASEVDECQECHKPAGIGGSGLYPRLSGQPAEYTLKQMRDFQTRARHNDKDEVMHDVAENMTEREMRAVAEYLAGLQ